jgi:acetylornithine deacetylase
MASAQSSDKGFTYDSYVDLLSRMIRHTESLQNKPPMLIPQESLIAEIVESELANMRYITIKRVEYVKNRPNLVIRYENHDDDKHITKSLGFIGSHMDVVPANPLEWKVDPFSLTIDQQNPDILWGRGTTDCLGHVALLVMLLKHLSVNCVKLDYVLGVVLIADEENGEDPEIGIPHLAKDGEMDFLKHGPVFWMDASDIYPTVGSGTGMGWELTVTGKRGHSGMPFNAINPVIFAMSATLGMLEMFKKMFPAVPAETIYKYPCSSNMKPTQWKPTEGSINQITSTATVQGDVRATPFYDWKEIRKVMSDYIGSLNHDPTQLPVFHESFPDHLNDQENTKVTFDLKWLGAPYRGIACDMGSQGFKLISEATEHVHGSMDVQSCCGSLPLIADLQDSGLDMQIIGYGNGEVYHANNEYCTFSGMKKGFDICVNVIHGYNKL